MFNRSTFENSRPDGFPVLEIIAPDEIGERTTRRFVPLRRTELRGEVTGPLAAFRLIQTYGYSRAQSELVLEARYRFPLPGDAAVTGVRVRFGDVEIQAQLRERGQAEDEYARARAAGQQAALATRESADVFTLQVAGLQPDQEITVETAYSQLAHAEGDGWSLRVPLTTSPRYVRQDESNSRPAEGQPLLVMRDPGHRFTLDVSFAGAATVESDTHELLLEQEDQCLRVRLRAGEVVPDRDCVLRWRPLQDEDQPRLQVWPDEDTAGDRTYFLALVAPPALKAAMPRIGREVILLVDHSGSMSGPKWDAADWAVKRFLSDLTPDDSFALGLFHNDTRWFAKEVQPATQQAVAAAISFLEGNRDSGGTELGVALEQALHLAPVGQASDAARQSRHVLIVTDAEVTDAGRILRLADKEAGQKQRRRISLLCIDAAPNAFLVTQLAERGGGVARFLTSSPLEGDITTALDEVLADWAEPVLTGLRLAVNRPAVQAAGRTVASEPGAAGSLIDLGDLPAGRAQWVAGMIPHGQLAGLSFALQVGQRPVATWTPDETGPTIQPAVRALFGAQRILRLEFLSDAGYGEAELRKELARLGYDLDLAPQGRGKIYAENAREDATSAIRALLVREALAYGLASAETAFVATRLEAGRPVEGSVFVASALPSGWSSDFVSRSLAAPRMPYAQPVTSAAVDALNLPSFLRHSSGSSGVAGSQLARGTGHLFRPVSHRPPRRARPRSSTESRSSAAAGLCSTIRCKPARRPGSPIGSRSRASSCLSQPALRT